AGCAAALLPDAAVPGLAARGTGTAVRCPVAPGAGSSPAAGDPHGARRTLRVGLCAGPRAARLCQLARAGAVARLLSPPARPAARLGGALANEAPARGRDAAPGRRARRHLDEGVTQAG